MRARRSPIMQSRGSALFATAFMLVFLVIGLFLLLGAWVLAGDGDVDDALILLAFGTPFSLAAIFGIRGTWRELRIHRRDLAYKEAYPDEPWLWYDEWRSGRVAGHGGQKMRVIWCVAVFWSGVVGSMFFSGIPEFQRGSPVLVGTIPFIAISLGFYVWAIRLALRWRRFGASSLVLDTFPGVVGGSLRASLVLSSGVPPGDLRARLACRRVDHSEEDSPETTLWHDEVRLSADAASVRAEGFAIPMEFAVPPDREASSPLPEMQETVWEVDVWSDRGGKDYRASFQVPVFVTPESSDEGVPEREPSHAPVHAPDGARFEANSRIRVSPSTRGGTDFIFPYPRQAAATAWILLGLVAATGLCIWFLAGRVPLWVPTLFGVLDLALVWGALIFFTRRKHTRVASDAVRIRRGVFGLRWWRVVPKQQIASIDVAVLLEGETFMMYDLRLVRAGGCHVTVGTFIPSKLEAEWLATRMRETLEGR